jgi:hypothetical protein
MKTLTTIKIVSLNQIQIIKVLSLNLNPTQIQYSKRLIFQKDEHGFK